ncbi:LuxR C-terminal-related transcriptional regulator [Streptomyces sp900105245]|uniref:LuxR C-terminal-related transcriptional regulator n=1 Tax=Streptomyces sp. 900105245 TaxID=3154379 RepID=A0ABV1UK72_9ACTN
MPLHWPLVGRNAELAAFTAAWANRRCRAVVVYGPAGVGKSRLGEEYLTRAVQAGWKGSRVRVTEAAAAVPLGAIAHLIPAGLDLSDPVKVFADVARVLARPPQQRRRWVVYLDDLHLLDAPSAVLLRHLLDAGVVRLIMTVRAGKALGEAVDALCHGDAVHRVDLEVLNFAAVGDLLRAGLGGPVGRRTAHILHEASGGNVLYLRELVYGALQAEVLTSNGEIWELAEGALPSTPRLAELIGVRLSAASPAARPVLDLLALCEPLSLTDADNVSPEVLADLEVTGLIRVNLDVRRTMLTLSHPLYGEILRSDMPTLRRRALLLEQAKRVQAHGARRHDDALHIATWHLTATGTADPHLLTQAAFIARYAHDYHQALTLLQAMPEQHHTAVTRLLQGELHYELGHHNQAEAILGKLAEQVIGDNETFAVAMKRTENLFWGAARVSEALAINHTVRATITDPAMRQALAENEGAMRVVAGQTQEGLIRLGDVENSPDERIRLYGMEVKVHALSNAGRIGDAIRLGKRAYAEHVEADTRLVNLHSAMQLCPLSHAYQELGELRRGQETAEAGYARALEVRAWQPATGLANMLGRSLWLTGHAVAARRAYTESLALARDRHFLPILLRLAASGLAASAALLGDLEAAGAALADFSSYPDGSFLPGEDHLGEAWLLAARGQLMQARAVLTEAAQTAREAGSFTSEALLLTDIARMGGAKDVAGRLEELVTICDGAFAPVRARLAAALAADDPDQLSATAEDLETIGADLLAAEAATAAAAAWRRAGQKRCAAAAMTRASACAAHCEGARTPLLATAEVTSMLTAREREVALLAAVGTPSKEIAASLHLSIRTVDNHLQHAYTKLGVTTRRELANSLGGTRPARSVDYGPGAKRTPSSAGTR